MNLGRGHGSVSLKKKDGLFSERFGSSRGMAVGKDLEKKGEDCLHRAVMKGKQENLKKGFKVWLEERGRVAWDAVQMPRAVGGRRVGIRKRDLRKVESPKKRKRAPLTKGSHRRFYEKGSGGSTRLENQYHAPFQGIRVPPLRARSLGGGGSRGRAIEDGGRGMLGIKPARSVAVT